MKVLFIGHDAAPHGAQILLLNLLRWFRSRQSFPFEILLKEGGVLESDFAAIARCRVWRRPVSLQQRLLSLVRGDDLLKFYPDIDLVYSSTITNGELLETLAPLRCPVITHVHELENYINSCGKDNLVRIKRQTTLYLAPSEAVIENLTGRHGIARERVIKIPESIPVAAFATDGKELLRERRRAKLQIPPNAFVVGAIGTADWRKSPDLFAQLAAFVARHYPELPIYFVWVGGELSWELRYDLEKFGLKNIVFRPSTPDLLDYYHCFDVFTLVSRVDPYPLVCLEAAAVEKPIICFAGAGGMPEFVGEECGYVVPYLDIAGMAAKIVNLYENPDDARRFGIQGRKKVREEHDVAIVGGKIEKLMLECLAKR